MSQSCLTDPSLSIVADTSVAINLNASGCAVDVLRALPNRVILVDTVVAELHTDRRTGRDDTSLVRSLIDADLVGAAILANLKQSHFESLVVGPAAETLDDGEAATIACALEICAVAVSDDGKARALCERRYPKLVVASTVDLFAHDAVANALGRAREAEAVYAALQDARMRVLPRHEGWIVSLIGETRAKTCISLRGALRAHLTGA
jgi:predicted nucleic acid-binding protein